MGDNVHLAAVDIEPDEDNDPVEDNGLVVEDNSYLVAEDIDLQAEDKRQA